ncbi:MAG: ABC transporter substrate-binding protein [Sandaracinaceae bacterium]|nr:ABC transporter substrate-binding protein [Sandaracinaceae bacterium]
MRALAALAALALGGCSLGNPARDDCRSSDECRALFGGGFYCEPDTGRCESALTDACPEVFPAGAHDAPGTILLGTIFDRASPNQRARERAARLAVAGLDERGGIDGRRVALLHCDTSVAPALELAAHLVRAGVPAIVGPSSSSNVEAVFSAHRASGVLVISPSATAPQLDALDSSTPGLLWRTAPPDDLQTDVVVAELVSAGTSSIGIVTRQNDTYAQALSVRIQARARDAAITVGRTPQFADAAAIAGAAADVVAGGAPSAVLFISAQVADAAAFLDATAAIDAYDGVTIVLTDAAANEDLLSRTDAGRARFGQVVATRPATPDTVITSEFRSAYRAANEDEDPLLFSFTAHAYDATALVLLGTGAALGASDTVTGAAIAEGITRTYGGGPARELVAANFLAIIQELRRDATGVDVIGASGPLDYGEDEELVSGVYDVLAIDAGGPRFVVLRTVEAP